MEKIRTLPECMMDEMRDEISHGIKKSSFDEIVRRLKEDPALLMLTIALSERLKDERDMPVEKIMFLLGKVVILWEKANNRFNSQFEKKGS